MPVNLILNWDEVGKDNVISRDALSASQPVPEEEKMSLSEGEKTEAWGRSYSSRHSETQFLFP